MTDLVAFVVALPVAVQLIAAAYGPLDLARHPRGAALAALGLLVWLGIAAALSWWLGAPFVLGLGAYAVFFLAKHAALAWLARRRAAYQHPVWSDEQPTDASSEHREG